MFNKASDATISTSDWFSLNTDSIEADLLVGGDRHEKLTEIRPDNGGVEIPEWNVEPDETHDSGDNGISLFEEPDPDAYAETAEGIAEYEADLAAWRKYDEDAREKLSDLESEEGLPMWATLFRVEDHPVIRQECFEVGLRLFEHEDAKGILIGVDSCGHSFYESYWIGLRARIARGQLQYATPAEREAFVALLASEWEREGHGYTRDGRDRTQVCADEVRKLAGLDEPAESASASAGASS